MPWIRRQRNKRYSALEKVLTCNITKEPALIDIIEHGTDSHGLNATFLFPDILKGVHPNDVKKLFPELRNKAKTTGFAMDYGGTEYTVADNLNISKAEARVLVDNYWNGYKVQKEFNQEQIRQAMRSGYTLTILGHKRHINGLFSSNGGIRGKAERTCMNAPVQGSAADTITSAQYRIRKDPVLAAIGCTMRLQVYDEIVFNCPKKYAYIAVPRIQRHMAGALDGYDLEYCPDGLIVPLKAAYDMGYTYAEAK